MSTLAPAIPIEELRKKLEDLNIEPRFIRGILRDVEFKALLYKNHQLCYLHEYAKNFQDVKLSINQLSIIFQMNPRTVSKSICKGSQDLKPKGRHKSLDENIENDIVEEIKRRSNEGKAMTKKEVLMFVNMTYKKMLTHGWLNQFFLRHKDQIKKARSFPQEDTRLSIPRDYLKEHINNMHKYVDGRLSELTFNLDEVGTSEWEDRKPKNVFIDNNLDSNHITYSVSRKVSHMTILTCVSAAGDALTPLLITKHTIKDSLWETGLRQDEDVMIRIRDPPYISKELFEEYINVVFIPYLNSVREKINATSSEALLMMDSCSVHCDKSILKCLGENNVIVLTFPAHTTNIFQPLDLSLFGIFKKAKNTETDSEMQDEVNKSIIKCIQIYEQTATSFNIRGSFRRAGIIQNIKTSQKTVALKIENMINNPGFKEIWNLNIKINEISKRRQNQKFGIINIDYLPENCNIVLNSDENNYEDGEIEQFFQ